MTSIVCPLCAAWLICAPARGDDWAGSTPRGDGAASWQTASGGPITPRWRVRLGAATGGGGAVDGTNTGAFPTELTLAVRVAGPLSVTATALGVVSGNYQTLCNSRRNAFVGAGGLRLDFGNRQGGSWLSPFLEAHVGGGAQEGACHDGLAKVGGFASGGGSVGVDVWMGRAAISVAVAVDYLPVGTPLGGLVGFAYAL